MHALRKHLEYVACLSLAPMEVSTVSDFLLHIVSSSVGLSIFCLADSPDFFCNDCIKLKRPSYGRHLSKDGRPLADSDGEAESADSAAAGSHDNGDEDDDEYWMREDPDERACNKAVAVGNTPALGQCGVRSQPNHSCYEYEEQLISDKVMWQW